MKSIMIIALLTLMSVSTVLAQMAYEETFSPDPGYELTWMPGTNEFAGVENGYYKLHTQETNGAIEKYAYSESFGLYENIGFYFRCDVMVLATSWGFPQSLRLANDADPYDSSVGFRFDYDSVVSLHDSNGHSYLFGHYELGHWYTCEVGYCVDTGLVDMVMTDPDTGEDLYELRGVDFDPVPFNRIYLGERTIHGDGTDGTICFDNLVLVPYCSGDCPVAEEKTTWGDVKALYR